MTDGDGTPASGPARPADAASATPDASGPGSAAAAPRGLSRRGVLGLLGAGALGGGLVGSAAGVAADRAFAGARQAAGGVTYAFHGAHQAGITTPAQDRLHFAAFDVAEIDRAGLVSLLRDWSAAAARMTAGGSAGALGAVDGPYDSPPDDTGEALDLPPAGLTITFGLGPTLFTSGDGVDRFGIADRRPAALVDLPRFPGDALVPQATGGDLCIQACSDDPQVAVHAIRNLSRIAFGRASLRWSQLGFGRTSSTSRAQVTPRNLFGFKDGTANVKSEDTRQVEDHVWADAGSAPGEAWMRGGSYLVARRIRMTIETWDRSSLREQERVVGRTKGSGAPLIDRASHVRLAHPDANDGAVLLRRGYNFVDGNDELGRLNAGLFFLAFQRDPRTQFIPIQRSLARDAMNEYLRHVGSGIWAVPPGASRDGYVGETLFAS
jgi:deferrochelatase/peroxidase EfeB